MDNDLDKNTLIGLTTADTLANISAVISLLREMKFYDDGENDCEYGLFKLHTLIRNSLEYEIERIRLASNEKVVEL